MIIRTFSNDEAEALVAEGKARWFNSPETAAAFAAETAGAEYVGEISRVSIYRFLVLLAA